MPNVFRIGPYRFGFWSRENNEPPHVHVMRDSAEAKYWLMPVVKFARSHGFARHELNEIARLVRDHHERLLGAWNEHFNIDQDDA